MTSRYQLAASHKTNRRTAGHISITSTVWVNVDTALDVVLAANIGDVLEAQPCLLVGNEPVVCFFDAVTVVGGSPVNSFASGAAVATNGPPYSQWRADTSIYTFLGPAMHYTVQATDLASGYVTTRLRAMASTGTGKFVYANGTDYRAEFTVTNLGPADPN